MKTKKMLLGLMAVLMMALFATAVLAESVTLTGMVEMSEDGPVLNSNGETYLLDGEGADAMEGKNVSVTGTVEDGEGETKVLVIESIEEMAQ